MTIIHGFTSFNTITSAPRIARSWNVAPRTDKAIRANACVCRSRFEFVAHLFSAYALPGPTIIEFASVAFRMTNANARKPAERRLGNIGSTRDRSLARTRRRVRDSTGGQHARVIGSIRNCGNLANFGGKFGRRTMRLGEMCLHPLPCSVWMKARGRWQFKWLTWTDIELPNYCLLKITQTR